MINVFYSHSTKVKTVKIVRSGSATTRTQDSSMDADMLHYTHVWRAWRGILNASYEYMLLIRRMRDLAFSHPVGIIYQYLLYTLGTIPVSSGLTVQQLLMCPSNGPGQSLVPHRRCHIYRSTWKYSTYPLYCGWSRYRKLKHLVRTRYRMICMYDFLIVGEQPELEIWDEWGR